MFSNRLLRILLHPFFLGLVLTLALIVFTPDWFSKYRARNTATQYRNSEIYYFFEDIDSDGISEKVQFDLNNKSIIKFEVESNGQLVNTFKIAGTCISQNFFTTLNVNRDSYNELIVFSLRNDSIFLSVLNVLYSQPFLVKEKYIESQEAGVFEESPNAGIIGSFDYDGDLVNELIFYINTGYRLQPRNCYIYNTVTDSLIVSPKSGAPVVDPFLFDLDSDSIPEVIYGSIATGNMDSVFPYTDQKAWLIALDHNLQFEFEPEAFDKHPCQVTVYPFTPMTYKGLIVIKHYYGDDPINSTIALYNANGQCIVQKDISLAQLIHVLPGIENETFFVLDERILLMRFRENAFDTLRELPKPELPTNTPLAVLDANGDGRKEYIFQSNHSGEFYIASGDLSSFTTIQLESGRDSRIICSILKSGSNPDQLCISVWGLSSWFTYSVNPLYRFRFLVYLVIYLILSGLLNIVYLLLRYRVRMLYETRQKMNELQLRSVKSQMDPHFTFNILNSIGSLYSNNENRSMADYLFGKYAKLLRQTIVTSDQPEVTLEQELDFVKNYLDIEKFRMNNEFNYTVTIDRQVDTSVLIPRMLIYTFVENAVKYAVRQVEGHATLDISGYISDNRLNITITDNGPGLSGNRKTEVAGTGKGLVIVDEMVRLYYDMTRVRITYTISEINESGKCMGTKVHIDINLKI